MYERITGRHDAGVYGSFSGNSFVSCWLFGCIALLFWYGSASSLNAQYTVEHSTFSRGGTFTRNIVFTLRGGPYPAGQRIYVRNGINTTSVLYQGPGTLMGLGGVIGRFTEFQWNGLSSDNRSVDAFVLPSNGILQIGGTQANLNSSIDLGGGETPSVQVNYVSGKGGAVSIAVPPLELTIDLETGLIYKRFRIRVFNSDDVPINVDFGDGLVEIPPGSHEVDFEGPVDPFRLDNPVPLFGGDAGFEQSDDGFVHVDLSNDPSGEGVNIRPGIPQNFNPSNNPGAPQGDTGSGSGTGSTPSTNPPPPSENLPPGVTPDDGSNPFPSGGGSGGGGGGGGSSGGGSSDPSSPPPPDTDSSPSSPSDSPAAPSGDGSSGSVSGSGGGGGTIINNDNRVTNNTFEGDELDISGPASVAPADLSGLPSQGSGAGTGSDSSSLEGDLAGQVGGSNAGKALGAGGKLRGIGSGIVETLDSYRPFSNLTQGSGRDFDQFTVTLPGGRSVHVDLPTDSPSIPVFRLCCLFAMLWKAAVKVMEIFKI